MIPVNEPVVGAREMEYVDECLKTGWISSAGRFINEFETSWAKYCGVGHGVAVSNGTLALQIALRTLEFEPGDEVILPTFTIISCALGVLYNDAVPVLVDSDPVTWCMDVGQIEAKITDRTRAIMPVHIYGHPVDMDPVRDLAEKYDLRVIEDAAEAHGAEYLTHRGREDERWVRAGSLGDLSTFSFYANKLITTGEGGMVLTNDPAVADHLRTLRNLSYRTDRRFWHTELGYNFRMTNLQAAVGLGQVERIEQIVERKRWMGAAYTERLKGIPGLKLPIERPWARNVYWMYAVELEQAAGLDASQFAQNLQEREVQTRPFFIGMHAQPVLRDRGLFEGEEYPVADKISRQGLYLPSGMALSESQLDQVCEAVREVLT
ncbi:MAG: DegT/DnrJ/EryC1/StrS family aminotransferase [Chloroflexi bacterium]|nr:DegT/DnrJ/EryC1/StrS family aminotransferase [Chloroflexota bacterium]